MGSNCPLITKITSITKMLLQFRISILLIVILCQLLSLNQISARPNNLHEEHREYQYQQLSKLVFPPRYRNEMDSDRQTQQRISVAENVQSQWNQPNTAIATAAGTTSNDQYIQRQRSDCISRCDQSINQLDLLAQDITSQITRELETGELTRAQMSVPNWYENRVRQKYSELQSQHNHQYQQNVYEASKHLRIEDSSSSQNNNQQVQENIFGSDDLRQVQQTLFNQRQYQQQGEHFQEQSQNQQHIIYNKPIIRTDQRTYVNHEHEIMRQQPPAPPSYINSQIDTTITNQTNEERQTTNYVHPPPPPPQTATTTVNQFNYKNEEINRNEHTTNPKLTIYNRYGDVEDLGQVTEEKPVIISYPSREYQRNNTHTIRVHWRPMDVATEPTIQTTYNNRQDQETTDFEQENRETTYMYQPTEPTTTNTEENEERFTNTDEEHHRTTVVDIHTPRPIPNTGTRHNIYNRFDQETIEVVPNYQPRVRVNTTDFQILDHTREQVTTNTVRPQQPSKHRTIIETLNENEYLERLNTVRNQFTRWGYPQQTLTVYNSTINDGCIKHNDQIYIYSPQLRVYKKYDEHLDGELKVQQPNSYYTWNPRNPDRNSNEYKERMRVTINQFQRWDYPQQTESVYLSAIRNGFVHAGQRYVYNADGKRYEKINGEQIYTTPPAKYPERTIEETLYETRTMTLRQDLAMNGLDQLRPDEFNRTISTGRFEKSGIRFFFNSITDHFEPILENSLTGSQDNSHETVPVTALTNNEYKERLKIIKNQFSLWGYPAMKDTLYNMTINSGYFILNNNKYVYDDESKSYVIKFLTNSNDQRPSYPALDRSILRTTNEQYLDRLRQTENQFARWGQPQLNDHIYVSTLSNGYVHNGYRYLYNPETRRYDQYNLDDLSHMKLQSTPNDYTETDRYIQAIDLRHDIAINGLTPLEENEYESVIAVKRIEKNGFIFEYNEQTGHYEKIEHKVEEFDGPHHPVLNMSPAEYLERLRITQDQFAAWRYPILQMHIYNSTIASGGFTHMGYRYLYNPDKKIYEQKYRVENADVYNPNAGNGRRDTELDEEEENIDEVQQHVQKPMQYQIQPFHRSYDQTKTIVKLTDEEYHQRLEELHNEIHRLGFDSHGEQYSQQILNQTIENGGFNSPDGYRYIFNTIRQRYEKMGRIDQTNEQVIEIRQRQLADKLRLIDNHQFEQMTEQEINQTLTTGVFIRGGNKYLYNSDTERYEQIKINDDEKQRIFDRVQQILKQLNFRQISNHECQKIFQNGKIIRGGHHWLYNSLTGTLEKDEYVGEFAELSTNEYEDIYRKIQNELKRLGYAQMTSGQCNSTITTGKFERGGIYFIYNAENGLFERQALTQSENRDRLNVLRYELQNIKHRNLSDKEYRTIVSKGYFQHGGYRYEYNTKTGKFERIEMTQDEYIERIMQLRQQLKEIGYEQMTDSECKSIINSGTFNYGGYQWLYNYEMGRYEQGERSKIDQSINVNKLPSNTMEFDRTTYESTIPAATADQPNSQQHIRQKQPESERPKRPHQTEISKNRGDQPPQQIFDDYESSEDILEQEPNIGYYPTGQIRVTTLPSTRHRTEMEPFNADNQQTQPKINAGGQLTRSQTVEHRYHRTQTNYVQESSVPLNFASQNTLPDRINEEVDDGLPDPYPTDAYTTEVYTVGSEVDIRTTTPSYPKRRSPHDKQTVQKTDKIEDFGETYDKSKINDDDEQQKQSFNFNYNAHRNEEDLDGQRLVGPELDKLQNDKNRLSVEDTFIRNLEQRLQQTQSTPTRQTQQPSPTYRIPEQQQQPEDLTQQNINVESDKYKFQSTYAGDSQRPEDLTQQYVDPKMENLYDPTKSDNEYQQHQESEDLRKLHEQYIAGQLQTDDLAQQQQQTVEINEQNIQTVKAEINNEDEEAKVVEVTTKKPGFWNRFSNKIFG